MERTILVTGYTGRLGGLVARALRDDHGLTPRIMVRSARRSATDWQPPAGMDVVVGDYDEPDTLDAALAGVDAVFLVSPVHTDMRSRELSLAARASGSSSPPHIVKVSGLGTRLDSIVDSGRWHAEIEHGIREAGLRATFLRPVFFMQNLAFQATTMCDAGVLRGAVEDAKIAMVDTRDIADVAAATLAGGSPIEGQDVSVTGPEALTYEAVAEAASRAFARPVRYERQSLDKVRAALEAGNQPQWHIDILMQFNQAFREGWGEATSDTVGRVLGRPARTVDAFLAELAAAGSASGTDPFPS